MAQAADRHRGRRTELLLALSLLVLTGLVIHDWSAQPASRYTLTVALVDDHALELDPYEAYLGLDQAHYNGHIYSDKAPYQPMLAAPAFQAYRFVGGDAFPPGFPAGRFQDDTNYGLWWVTLWSSVIPAMALAVLIRRVLTRTHPELATRVALAIMLGTTILPFAGWLFGHVVAALCITGAWHLLRGEERPSTAAVFSAGALLGAGIGAEYAVAVIAAVMLVHVATMRSWARLLALSAGTVIATVPLLVYNWLAFGGPFEVSYQGHLKSFEGEGALGVYNLQLPHLDEITKTLVGNRGLFVVTPVVLVAVLGAIVAIVLRGPTRRDAWVALASLVAMLAVSTGIDGYGGDSPGPRYLIPALPLLAVPLAEVWRRIPSVCGLTAGIGAIVMLVATITDPAIDTSDPQPIRVWLDHLRAGELAQNVLTGQSHSWLLLLSTGGGLALVALLVRAERATGAGEPLAAVSGPGGGSARARPGQPCPEATESPAGAPETHASRG